MLDPDGPVAPCLRPMPTATPTTIASNTVPSDRRSIRAVRTISNLIVDQTLGNPAGDPDRAAARRRRGRRDQMTVTAQISAAYEPLRPLFDDLSSAAARLRERRRGRCASPNNAALQQAAAEASC